MSNYRARRAPAQLDPLVGQKLQIVCGGRQLIIAQQPRETVAGKKKPVTGANVTFQTVKLEGRRGP